MDMWGRVLGVAGDTKEMMEFPVNLDAGSVRLWNLTESLWIFSWRSIRR